MPFWLDRRNIRGAISVLAYAVSLGANFFTSNHPLWGSGIIAFAVLLSVVLFLPELRKLRLIVRKNEQTESPRWLYLFGIAAIGMVGFSCFSLYREFADRPTILTEPEFAQSLISGKYIKIADFADSNNVIEGRTFEDSHIYGPAVLFLTDHTLLGESYFEGNLSANFLVAQSGNAGRRTGVIAVKNSTFKRCHFYNITLVGDQHIIDQAKQSFTIE